MLRSPIRCLLLRRPRRVLTCQRPFSSPTYAEVEDTPGQSLPGHARASAPLSLERSPEQERAARLEYEGMLKLTDQVLALENMQPSNLRDVKLTLNYWTSVRAHHQARHDSQNSSEQQHALKLFRALMERGDPAFVQNIIKTEENPMGGLVYLIEHLLFAFRGTHQLMLIENTQHQSHLHRDDLLNALLQASNVLLTMDALQADPNYPGIPQDLLTVSLMELSLWSKRIWFLTQFGNDKLTDAQIEGACGGQSTVKDCMTAMTCLADDLLRQEDVPLTKLYTTLISTWVHSGLPESMDVVLDLLNDMEEDERIQELSPIPYSAVMYLCVKQQDAADVAQQLWQHMRAPDSGVEPDATTLATLLLALIDSNQLDHALVILNEVEGGQGIQCGQTSTTCYNVLLHGLAKSRRPDAARQAEALLQRMTELSESGINPWVAPDRISYSTVMEILSNRGGAKVEAILLRCKSSATHNPALEPDRVMYNIVLGSYAMASDGNTRGHQSNNSVSASQRAEALLRTMESNPDSLPDTISYNSVLNVFAKSSVDFERIEALFQEMKDKSSAGDDTVKPDIITYNTVLRAIARDGREDSIDRAETFMEEMRQNDMEPDRVTFNTLMHSIVKSNSTGAASRAERILEKMELDHETGGIRPDATSYNTVLNGYAKAGSVKAVQSAEQLLQRMLALAQDESRSDCRPDFVSYTCVMDAYARSHTPDAGFQAEALLSSMDREGVSVNASCYNSAINCWAKSKHVNAPLRAENLLNRMQQDAANNPLVKPNSVSFSSVMNCWAQSSLDGAAERADAIMNRMELLAKNGDRGMHPNAYSYSTVISAWAKIGRADAALAILNRVEEAHVSGRSQVYPNFACYNAAINAIAKSKRKHKAEEAAAILNRMKLSHSKTGYADAAPTPISYSSVLNACAYTVCKNAEERSNAFRIARETLRDLLNNHEPTPGCYVNFFLACARLLADGPNRDEMVVALFRDCQQRGHVNDRVTDSFERAVPRHVFLQETDRLRG